MIELRNASTDEVIKVPVLGENIPTEYFENCVKNVGVAKYYCLVALIYKDKLSVLYTTYKGKKNNALMSSVSVILVKADMDAIRETLPGICVGNPLVVGGSAVAMGHHITSKENVLEIENVMRHISKDKELGKSVSLTGPNADAICKFVEFKIIPYNEIKGYYSVNSKE